MQRRRFLGNMTLLGLGSLASMAAVEAVEKHDPSQGAGIRTSHITYAVKGFTCITCALGLEVLLRQQKGVLTATADYPTAVTRIDYDATLVTEASLRAAVQEAGFTATLLNGLPSPRSE